MTDELNTQSIEETANPQEMAQDEQVATADEVAEAPDTATDTADEDSRKLAGKFDTVEDLEKSYQELQSKFTQSRQSEARPAYEQSPDVGRYEPTGQGVEIDPDSREVVNTILREQGLSRETLIGDALELVKVQQFLKDHGKELSQDKLLSSRVKDIIREYNSQDKNIDQYDAYAQAKTELESRVGTQVKEAKQTAIKEGQELAKKKAESGAVGESSAKQKVNPEVLGSADFAKYHNLPRSNQ